MVTSVVIQYCSFGTGVEQAFASASASAVGGRMAGAQTHIGCKPLVMAFAVELALAVACRYSLI